MARPPGVPMSMRSGRSSIVDGSVGGTSSISPNHDQCSHNRLLRPRAPEHIRPVLYNLRRYDYWHGSVTEAAARTAPGHGSARQCLVTVFVIRGRTRRVGSVGSEVAVTVVVGCQNPEVPPSDATAPERSFMSAEHVGLSRRKHCLQDLFGKGFRAPVFRRGSARQA